MPPWLNGSDQRPGRDTVEVGRPFGIIRMKAALFRTVPDPKRAKAAILEQIKRNAEMEIRANFSKATRSFKPVEPFPENRLFGDHI
jgi:hypothetical protein